MEIEYNRRAFIYVGLGVLIGAIFLYIGDIFENKFFFLIGGMLLLANILVGFLFTGLILALRWYSNVGGFLEGRSDEN